MTDLFGTWTAINRARARAQDRERRRVALRLVSMAERCVFESSLEFERSSFEYERLMQLRVQLRTTLAELLAHVAKDNGVEALEDAAISNLKEEG